MALRMLPAARLRRDPASKGAVTGYVVSGLRRGRYVFIGSDGDRGWELAVGNTVRDSTVIKTGFASPAEALSFLQSNDERDDADPAWGIR